MIDGKSITGFEAAIIEENAYSLIEANAAYREATLEVERSIIEEWAATAEEETEKRERLWLKLQILKEAFGEVERYHDEYIGRKTQSTH